jgi:cation diffusion facilitator family transporter
MPAPHAAILRRGAGGAGATTLPVKREHTVGTTFEVCEVDALNLQKPITPAPHASIAAMSPARRTALASVAAAVALMGMKLVVGLMTNSLGLVSEAVHSGTDFVAALLTFFAIGVAVRPADATHAWGHGKAEHLSALAEGVILAAVSLFIAYHAVQRLTGKADAEVQATWYAFAVIAVVLAIDLTRMAISLRTARRYNSPALFSNAVHFAGDFAGTLAVLVGLLFVRAGHPKGDAAAALFVAVLVLVAAARLAKVNADVLMDRTPPDAESAARSAIEALGPAITLDRLRMRHAAGRHFTDVVISVAPTAALAEGHAAADAVEAAVHAALPDSDVVVHVEPGRGEPGSLTDAALGAALSVPGVREIHNVRVVRVGDHLEVSLHLKLPGDDSLDAAHDVASRVEDAIAAAMPERAVVTTHLEPLDPAIAAERPSPADVAATEARVRTVVGAVDGAEPREVRFVRTDDGLVAYLTLGLAGERSLSDAHEVGGEVRARLRRECPELQDVVVHTEPAA